MINFNIQQLNFKKNQGLLPVIVQDIDSGCVLMLGYMNQTALEKTMTCNKVTFFSRRKNRLWTKGETSGNFLIPVNISTDCDQDTLLIQAKACGPTCHRGKQSCFDAKITAWEFILDLEKLINTRIAQQPDGSYISKLYQTGITKLAQKIGEEGVEVALAAIAEGQSALLNESADLLLHLLVLLAAKKLTISDVVKILISRNKHNEPTSQ